MRRQWLRRWLAAIVLFIFSVSTAVSISNAIHLPTAMDHSVRFSLIHYLPWLSLLLLLRLGPNGTTFVILGCTILFLHLYPLLNLNWFGSLLVEQLLLFQCVGKPCTRQDFTAAPNWSSQDSQSWMNAKHTKLNNNNNKHVGSWRGPWYPICDVDATVKMKMLENTDWCTDCCRTNTVRHHRPSAFSLSGKG